MKLLEILDDQKFALSLEFNYSNQGSYWNCYVVDYNTDVFYYTEI